MRPAGAVIRLLALTLAALGAAASEGRPAEDNTNRSDPLFAPIDDPFADRIMAEQMANMPVLEEQILGLGRWPLPSFAPPHAGSDGRLRDYDRYDQQFLAAAWYWIRQIDEPRDPSHIADAAYLIKAIAWFESQVGYRSGFQNRRPNGGLRFPLQPAGFVDTEDVLQVGNPADLPIHEKVREMSHLLYTRSADSSALVPRTYTHRNITGPQSIFYGTGWLAYKYVTVRRSVWNSICRYNGNRRIDRWNAKEHRVNYADSVVDLFKTGIARNPGDGRSIPLVSSP